MRLIDADALLEELKKTGRYFQAKFDIENAPTVSEITKEKLSIAYDQGYEDGKKNWLQEERPQGKWIRYRVNPHQPEHIKCSNCGQYWSIADHDKIFDICFRCGADMRGKKDV